MESKSPHDRQDFARQSITSSDTMSANIFQFPQHIADTGERLQAIITHSQSAEDTKEGQEALKTSNKYVEESYTSTEIDKLRILNGMITNRLSGLQIERDYLKHLQMKEPNLSNSVPGDAIEELASLYTILDELSNIQEALNKRKQFLGQVRSSRQQLKSSEKAVALNRSTLMDPPQTAGSCKPNVKIEQDDSKPFIQNDFSFCQQRENSGKKITNRRPHGMRGHQITHNDVQKSNVSKWTRVKAVFKWEHANVIAPAERERTDHSVRHRNAAVPNELEVPRYLQAPNLSCGGTIPTDSVPSSPSGHILSETELQRDTPSSTISSTSSMDDIKSSRSQTYRRHSMNSITHICGDKTGTLEVGENMDQIQHHPRYFSTQTKTCCNRPLRKSLPLHDFEVLPENAEANLQNTPSRKTKLPPSPLNLDHQTDLHDLEQLYSPKQLKSPKRGYQFFNYFRAISSPVNSSVPSSPSRFSDCYAELESEDLSSGNFSDTTTPNHMNMQRQDEIHKKYELLKKKLDLEFQSKRRKWEQMKVNPANVCRTPAYTTSSSPKDDDMEPIQAKLLEESLSPDFQKKLRKWRVKKQTSIGSVTTSQPTSPIKDNANDTKEKIDWNLWKSGQLKLKGQGFSQLPDEKDLSEEFQKKLEQWNNIKKSNSMGCYVDTLGRTTKYGDGTQKVTEEVRRAGKERKADKLKCPEKDKFDKLAKLKAIVTDHPAKEVEVKTAAGVMKFEGISRKFTRKLYEWEKARGIGPESSTFALLHSGYCPVDVGRVPKEYHSSQDSPSLSRSLSLSSISENATFPSVSHQVSSLSLNNVNYLKQLEAIGSNDILAEVELKKYEEPEAVIVEVEDRIEETASPLITDHPVIDEQTPIYKYEELACTDYCDELKIESYESNTHLSPLLTVIRRTQDLLEELLLSSDDITLKGYLSQCQISLAFVRSINSSFKNNMKYLKTSDFENEITRLAELLKATSDEACCREVLEERSKEYSEQCRRLNETLELLHRSLEGNRNSHSIDIASEINITSEDGFDSPSHRTYDDTNSSTILESTETNATVYSLHNCSIPNSKKKLRSRKLGSRQNSKTDSDSSDSDIHSVVETPRRWKRKTNRVKQRSLDEDSKKTEQSTEAVDCQNEDMVYILNIKPGQPITQHSGVNCTSEVCYPKVLISPTESCVQLMAIETQKTSAPVLPDANDNSNIFVKTRRTIFKAIEDPLTACGLYFVEQDVDDLKPEDDSVYDIIPVESKISPVQEDSHNRVPEDRIKEYVVDSELEANFENQTALGSTSQSKSEADPLVRKQILFKSWSWNSFRMVDPYEFRKSLSYNNINCSLRRRNRYRIPLATDSFKTIKKCFLECRYGPQKHIQHHFKKNTEKSFKSHNKSSNKAAAKKIESKINYIKMEKVDCTIDQFDLLGSEENDTVYSSVGNPDDISKAEEVQNSSKLHVPSSAYQTTDLNNYLLEKCSERFQQKAEQDFFGDAIISKTEPNSDFKNDILSENHDAKFYFDNSSVPTDMVISYIPQPNAQSEPESIHNNSRKPTSRLGFTNLASKLKRVRVKPEELSSDKGTNHLSTLLQDTSLRKSVIPDGSTRKVKSLQIVAVDRNTEKQDLAQSSRVLSDQNIMRLKESCV